MQRTGLILASLLVVMVSPLVSAQETDTLSTLRQDLGSGSLRPVLERQDIVHFPAAVLDRWLADTSFQGFAITGFNQDRERFAARLRLQHRAQDSENVSFIRIAGRVGDDYTIDQFYDYGTGLDLSQLAKQAKWLKTAQGQQFLAMLSRDPGSAELEALADSRTPFLALWLAQCIGQPCESKALNAQLPIDEPAIWTLRRGFAWEDRDTALSSLRGLRQKLGDDPWLWRITGIYAHYYQHCDWIIKDLQEAWTASGSDALADSALQCTLSSMEHDENSSSAGTHFLDRLSETIGRERLSRAINAYYLQDQRPVPSVFSPWIIGQTGE